MGSFRQFMSVTGRKSHNFVRDCGRMIEFVGATAAGLYGAVRHPRRVRWRETFYYMDMCGSDALPIVTVICYLMGLIIGFQSAVQMHRFGADIYVADLVGLSVVKELGPLMVAMIATGRAGSAFAAEVGSMKASDEIDALTTMGFSSTRFLVIPKLLAMLTVMPVLTLFGSLMGVLGGLTVGVFQLDMPIVTYMNRTFAALEPIHLVEGLTKSVVFAMLIATVGCLRGFEASRDAQGVGRSTTSAVVSGIFMVIVADSILTMLFSMT